MDISELVASLRAGAGRAYCNTGFLLLGLVIEAATGQSWAAAVTAQLISPLGLSAAATGPAVLPLPHARGHLAVDGRPVDVTEFDPAQAGAAGAIVSTLADLSFFRALLGGELRTPDALAALP